MLRIVDDLNWQECCNGIMCGECQFYIDEKLGEKDACRIKEWLSKQPRFDDKERMIPVANITFDEEKLKELCDKAISDLIITCPNCGTEIKPKKEVDS